MADVRLIKKMYIDGHTPDDICNALSIGRGTYYYHLKKNKDEWDNLKYAKSIDVKDLDLKEKEFLSILIDTFEKSFEEIKKSDLENKLQILNEYVKSYYKLKAPKDIDCKSQVIEAVMNTIYQISDIALEHKNSAVINFLSEHSEIITELALKSKKR
jgi:hypothetical protein